MADREIDPTDLAWAAGFIEGEGHFKFYWRHRQSTGQLYFEPSVQADNTKKEYLDFLKSLFGGSICLTHTKGKKIGKYRTKKDTWRWHATNLKAFNVCRLLEPFLHGDNKKAAQLIVEYYENRPPRRRHRGGQFKVDHRRREYNAAFTERLAVALGH